MSYLSSGPRVPWHTCPSFTRGKSFLFVLVASRLKPCNSNESKCTTPWHFNLATREKAQIGHYTTFEKACVKKRTHITDIHYTCCDNFKKQMISAGKAVGNLVPHTAASGNRKGRQVKWPYGFRGTQDKLCYSACLKEDNLTVKICTHTYESLKKHIW